jgi:hypothetical protein
MKAELLDVILPYNNPLRWRSRLDNFRRCEDGMLACGVRLTTVELAYGDRPFDLPDRDGIRRVRVRGRDVLWHKESLNRIGVASLPSDSQYHMTCDGDFLFHDPNFAHEVVHALQLHPVVQVSDRLIWLGPKGEYVGNASSFMHQYKRGRRRHFKHRYYHPSSPMRLEHGYPGGAWAYRRQAYQAMGGLLDICILGSGDMHMALGLMGLPDRVMMDRDYTSAYRETIAMWGERAAQAIRFDVGYVPGLAFHLWHGCLANRAYTTRPQILIRNRFDPNVDLVRDHQGLTEFAGNKPRLVADIRAYFAERDEDSTWLGPEI